MSEKTKISTLSGIVVAGIALYALIQFSQGEIGKVLVACVIGMIVLGFVTRKKKPPLESEIESNIDISATPEVFSDRPSHGISHRISISNEDEYSLERSQKQLLKLTFHRCDETIDIHGYAIDGPIYTGKRDRHFYGEPAVIDPQLKVTTGKLADALGYWPNYGDLTPAQRGNYLSWLSSGRGHCDELGYVFLYLYGLERYVYRDAEKDSKEKRNETLNFIVDEVQRLRTLFPESRSFDDYTNNLIDAIYVKFWSEKLTKRKGVFPTRSPIAASHAIILQANSSQDEQLDADWALQWVLGFGGVRRTTAVRENYAGDRASFRHAYEQSTKGGMKIPKCIRKAGTLYFSPSSQGLGDAAGQEYPADWYSPLELKRPLGKLEEIFREVAPSVRKLSKAIASKDVLELLNAWPRGMPTTYSSQLSTIVEKLQRVIDTEKELRVSTLLQVFKQPATDKLTTTQVRKIASALETCGYVIVPDPICTPVPLKSTDLIVTYKGERLKGMSPEGGHVATAVQLGTMLALADGEAHEHEVEIIRKLVNSHPNSSEREYLHHYAEWRLSQPASTAGLKQGIDQLNDTQKNDLSEMLIALARADGLLPKDEVKELEKLFKRLGLENGRVSEMLHSSATNNPVTEKPKNRVQETDNKSAVAIDYEALKTHAASTREVQSVLSRIFEEEAEVEDDIPASLPEDNGTWHSGRRDGPHDALATWLLTSNEWPMESVTKKCLELTLMPDGALTAINEAAFEALGDSLIEIGDPVEVYRDVLEDHK
jgi:uncharacterized tellurite resistance protein B-like protein